MTLSRDLFLYNINDKKETLIGAGRYTFVDAIGPDNREYIVILGTRIGMLKDALTMTHSALGITIDDQQPCQPCKPRRDDGRPIGVDGLNHPESD